MRKINLALVSIFSLFCLLSWLKTGTCQMPQKVAISMDFKDANLKDVLKIFSQQSGLNFIASEDIEDRLVTLYLDKVSVEDSLNTILKANNLTYEQPEGSNIIIIKDIISPEVETITRVYSLNYAKADAVRDLFEKMREEKNSTEKGKRETGEPIRTAGLLTEYGKIVSDTRTNSIIITDIPAQFPIIEETLAKLDEATPQVMIEAELLETTVDNINKLGIKWADTIGVYTGPKQTTKFPFRKHDFPAGTDKVTDIAYGTISMASFTASLQLLQTDKDTKLLARPRVLTLNNETAQINLTAQTAVASITTIQGVAGTTGVQTTTAERIQTGILLKVTPQVNKDNYITMFLEPSVTTAVKSPFFTTQEYVDPHTRSVKTTVRVKDGDTLAIGGLINTEDTRTKKKVPILGDIPVLGYLFKNTDQDKEDKELIIFITPHIFKEYITPPNAAVIERESSAPADVSEDEVMEDLLDKFNKK